MKRILDILLLLLGVLTIVIPNSFQNASFILQLIIVVLITIKGQLMFNKFIFFFWLIISIWISFYIFVSPQSNVEKGHLILRYIISPFSWIVILHHVIRCYNWYKLRDVLIYLSFLASLTVLIFYCLFFNGYSEFLNYIIQNPNLDLKTGLGFRMHVYGTLIFFAISLYLVLSSIRSGLFKLLYFTVLLIAMVLSGRTALILSFVIGFIFLIYSSLKIKNIGFNTVFMVIFSPIIFYYISTTDIIGSGTTFFEVGEEHIDKINEKGGEERNIQLVQIISHTLHHPFGSGFISVSIKRSDKRLWQYETLIPAFVMRFGIITSLMTVFSIILLIRHAMIDLPADLSNFRSLLIMGFIAILIASFTNPYLEAPAFQWMYFLPITFLYNIKRLKWISQ